MNATPIIEPLWDEEESQILIDLTAWLNAPAVGENLPNGATNGSLLMNNAGWQAATTSEARCLFLEDYTPISTLWERAKQRIKWQLLKLKMVVMILDWIAGVVQGHQE